MLSDCTLTTACFDLTKYNQHSRNVEQTIDNIKSLLELPCYLIIYTDLFYFPILKELRQHLDDFTHYVVMTLEEFNTFKYKDKVHENRIKYHPTKDERTCPESHLLCSSKFEMVLNSINNNPFNTSKFGWIDSNVGIHFKKMCVDYKNNKLLHILNQCHENKFYLQILNVCDPNLKNHLHEYYKQYRWVVCGCLFITSIEKGIPILNELNQIFINHTEAGYGHGEEMYYLEILDKYKEDLHLSYGDYHHILNNFIKPTVGIDYILHCIIPKYLQFKQYERCIHCCELIIEQYENYEIEINYEYYYKILFNCYVAWFYVDKNNAKKIIEKINYLICINKIAKSTYLNDQSFYDSQIKLL